MGTAALSRGELIPGVLHRFEDCQQTGVCYAVIKSAITPNLASGIARGYELPNWNIICALDIYGSRGNYTGTLQQTVNATFYNGVGKAPVVFNYGSRRGTRTWFLAKWRMLSGPHPYPGWQRYARDYASSMLGGGSLRDRKSSLIHPPLMLLPS